MGDKVRGALFAVLGDISGLTVLDPFAGSGAISFEAISRGARYATAIESEESAQRAITENIKSLDVARYVKLVKASASSWHTTAGDIKYDLVICDPPYHDKQLSLIEKLATRVGKQGILVLSWPGNETVPEFSGYTIAVQKSYGDAQLIFYNRAA